MYQTPPAHIIKLRIKAIREETRDTKSFILENIGNKPIVYKSGQFLTLLFQHANGEEVRRSYSVTSSPKLEEPLTITVKKIPNGEFSRKLVDHAQVGDILYSIGASGLFTLPEDLIIGDHRFCFLAAGSGITPIFAHIKTLLYSYQNTSVLLIYSNRNAASTLFFQDLMQLKEIFNTRLVIEFLFSESTSIIQSRLTQTVMDILAQKHALYVPNVLFYLCGPQAYMRMINIKLRAEGVSSERIKKELFVVDAPTFKLPEPTDKAQHAVKIQLHDQEYSIQVQYPDSILTVAKKQQIPLPYSCENGQCGTCAVLCTKGKVWMQYNEVLGDKALTAGYVLTCTGYPVEGPVELKVE